MDMVHFPNSPLKIMDYIEKLSLELKLSYLTLLKTDEFRHSPDLLKALLLKT